MNAGEIILIVFGAVALVVFALLMLNRWAAKKSVEQQDIVSKNKQSMDIFVIDKKKDRIANVNLPKAVSEKVPRLYKVLKLHFVKVKVGPQIVTMMCEKGIYNYLQTKKNYRVEAAGLSIVSVRGMKSAYEMKKAAKEKKAKAAAAAKSAKGAKKK